MAIPDDDHGHGLVDVNGANPPQPESGLNQWLLATTLALVVGVVVAVGYTLHEQNAAQKLASVNGNLAGELRQTQAQVAALSAKLKALTTAPVDENWDSVTRRPATGARPVHHPVVRPRQPAWQRSIERQLAAEQQRLNGAERAIAKTQADVASNSLSTQNSLNGLGDSIAKNHAQLVALEELGMRNYYEFDLKKSKRFAREGPVGLALRHTSEKHHNYDVDLLVDDFKLNRKHVNLYEPVIFETSRSPQPLELVVNRIGKNEIHGYISVPKTYGQRHLRPVAAASLPARSIANPSAQPTAVAVERSSVAQVTPAAHQ